MSDKLQEIRARHAAATPGPYVWHGWGGRERKAIQIELCTTHSGMQIVMAFKRSGFDGAVPVFCTGDVSKRNNLMAGGNLKPVGAFAHYPKDYKDEIKGIDHADATAIEKSWEDIDFLIAEVDRLHSQQPSIEQMLRTMELTPEQGEQLINCVRSRIRKPSEPAA